MLTKEAREGLEHAWLAILRERDPGVDWVIVQPEDAAEKEAHHPAVDRPWVVAGS